MRSKIRYLPMISIAYRLAIHFYYMCTKLFSDGAIHQYFTPYDTPYEAFINYMNVLSDFIRRVEEETDRKKTRTSERRKRTEKKPGK